MAAAENRDFVAFQEYNQVFHRTIGEGGQVTLMDTAFRKRTLAFDDVVLASVEPNDSLYDELLEQAVNAAKIGEACGFQGIYSAEYWDPQGRPYDPLLVAKCIIRSIVENL